MISKEFGQWPLAGDTNDEIAALIDALHQTEQRLADLTAGEVDTVANRDGTTILLRRAQDYLRRDEAAKQAAILDALPAQIALLDTKGLILSVNEAWRQFAGANTLPGLGGEVGMNYLAICDSATGGDAPQARQVADGIRSVLSGAEKSISFEYSCHSPTGQGWFLSTVTPLANDRADGAILMRRDVTAERQAVDDQHTSELRFRQLAENIREVFWLTNTAKSEMLYVSPGYEKIWGRSCESLHASPRDWIDSIHPEDRERVLQAAQTNQASDECVEEYRIIRADGAIRWIRDRAFPILDNTGKVYRIAGLAEDITERKKADQRFKDLLEFSPDALIVINRDGEMVLVNSRAVQLFGWRREELLGRNIEMLMPAAFAAKHGVNRSGYYAQPLVREMGAGRELSGLRKDGTTFLAEVSLSPLETDGGTWVMSAIRDISERKAAEHRIAELNRVYAMLSGINTLIVHVSGRDELFREACRVAVEAGGFRMSLIAMVDPSTMEAVPVAWAGMDNELLTAVKDRLSSKEGASPTMIARAIREKKSVISNVVHNDPQVLLGPQHAQAGVRSLAVLPLIVADEAVGVLALYADEIEFFRDEEMKLLTELSDDIAFAIDHIDKQERLAYLAYYDGLTGLANRRLFTDRVAQYLHAAASSGHKLALFIFDLERFRNINASLGRPAGDALLRQVARWLTQLAEDADLVARLDADHFSLVLPKVIQGADLGRLLDKAMAAFLKHPFELNDTVYRIAAKAGVALFPDDGTDADTLLKHAEAAVIKAKVAGDRYLFYAQKLNDTMTGGLGLENQLRQAVDNHEFVLHYQPKVNLVSGELTGAEALLRWNDPQTGLVPPGRFIRILEDTGLIKEVGLWALHAAIAEHLRWRSAGLPALRIAVNVSALQLRSQGFVAEIAQIVASSPNAAAGLELEITESLIMEDVKHSVVTLRAIRAMGVRIAIDDFGTGFSSLSYLSKLPVDTLKIDRSFVIDMANGEDGRTLVSVIINLAHALKLTVVAEGVETKEQLRQLQLLNCDEIQGYLYGRPVPGEIFARQYLQHPAIG
ncbi:MAG TPA: EAL domain-containing protein [Steroidobacteraceae bacterium]|nr:EAL domain-containing protein [Steroidobacteraceae bacterium]